MPTFTPLPAPEQLRQLAEQDPQALEALRLQLVDELIAQAPESRQQRLRGLQFQIDMERWRAKTPMAACIKLSQMMHDSLYTLNLALKGEPLPTSQQARAEPTATVTPFRTREARA